MNWSQLFSLFLLTLSGGMLWFHVRAWRMRQREPLRDQERSFLWRQCKRRVLTSGLIGIMGGAVAVNQVFSDPMKTGFYWYWAALMTVVIVLGVLALADMRSSHQYARELSISNIVPHRFPSSTPATPTRADASERDG